MAQWLMVQFGFLSAYGLFDLYMHFQKGDANGHPKRPKVESVAYITIFAKTTWGLPPFGFLQNSSSLRS